jgi:hypothetical protein
MNPIGNRWGFRWGRPTTNVQSFKPVAMSFVLSATMALWGGFLLVILKALKMSTTLTAAEVDTTVVVSRKPSILYALWRGREIDV